VWTRRNILTATAALSALPFARPALADSPAGTVALRARERTLSLIPETQSPVWTYGDNWPLVLRTPRGHPFRARLENGLTEHTTIHWHGIRVPNAMDGVPYMTQPPVEPGQSFDYAFSPPDAGTFFFHPHCDTVQQLGRGLAGVLIVEDEAERGRFLADLVCAIKDWRLKDDGSFDAFSIDKGAANAGTFGSLETVNGAATGKLEALENGWVRLRVLNLDVTRIVVLALDGADGFVIATDGNTLPPVPLKTWRLGPAMRLDIAFRMPPRQSVRLQNVWGAEPQLLAEIAPIQSALPAIGTDRLRSDRRPRLAGTGSVPQRDRARYRRAVSAAAHLLGDQRQVLVGPGPQAAAAAAGGIEVRQVVCLRSVERHPPPAPDPSARPYLPRAALQQARDRAPPGGHRAGRAEGAG
jgi:FtsP/CotA-like multicopper oxidase with cupredoxin domain